MRLVPQTLVGEPAHLRDLIRPDAIGLHELPALVGPVGGELPIREVGAPAERLRVGVAFDEYLVGQFPQLPGEQS